MEAGGLITFSDLPSLPMRNAHLLQPFQNLISNAIQVSEAGAVQIHISAGCGTRAAGFRVQDNGLGIPRYQQQVVGIFKRLHGPEEYPGTGTGKARHLFTVPAAGNAV